MSPSLLQLWLCLQPRSHPWSLVSPTLPAGSRRERCQYATLFSTLNSSGSSASPSRRHSSDRTPSTSKISPGEPRQDCQGWWRYSCFTKPWPKDTSRWSHLWRPSAGIALPVGFGALIGERPGSVALVGIVLALPAIALISTSTERSESVLWRGGVVHGLMAGFGFGGFFILISRSSEASGMWPLVSARIATVVTMALILIVSGAVSIPQRSKWPLVSLAGVADVLANLFFIVSVRGSLLILSSVIVSLYPVSTLILARIVLGERTSPVQRKGLLLGAVAVVAISVG